LNNKTDVANTNGQFEMALIAYLARQSVFANDYDRLAKYLSERSGKVIEGRKITFMARGDAYAKKWLKKTLLEAAVKFGWVPYSPTDWENSIWSITGRRQSVYGGNNEPIYTWLADVGDKTEDVYKHAYENMLQESNYGHNF
jgi:hypothetical protein